MGRASGRCGRGWKGGWGLGRVGAGSCCDARQPSRPRSVCSLRPVLRLAGLVLRLPALRRSCQQGLKDAHHPAENTCRKGVATCCTRLARCVLYGHHSWLWCVGWSARTKANTHWPSRVFSLSLSNTLAASPLFSTHTRLTLAGFISLSQHTVSVVVPSHHSRRLHRQPGGYHASKHELHSIPSLTA
jgi:hypothetical protein